jgi:hypothetical protein
MSDLPRYITGRVTNGSTRFFNVGTSRGKTGKKQQHGAALHAPIQHSSSEPRDHRPIQVYHVSQSLGRKPREPVGFSLSLRESQREEGFLAGALGMTTK